MPVVTRTGETTWQHVEGGVLASCMKRPDGRSLVKLPSASVEVWPALCEAIARDVSGPLLAGADEEDSVSMSGLAAAGFAADRREQQWMIPLTDRADDPRLELSTTHRLRRVTDVDLAALTDFDNLLRQDVLGTAGWQETTAGMAESLQDDEFDPDLYLVAEDRRTGRYDGIIRVWMKQPVPKLGFIGVRREWRRTRLAASLLGSAKTALIDKGVTHVITSTDVNNTASHTMACRHGGIPTALWVYYVKK